MTALNKKKAIYIFTLLFSLKLSSSPSVKSLVIIYPF
jgi:hypothetical protein